MLGYATRVRLILAITSILFTVTNAAAQQRADFGTLSIQVRPPDAEIFIDGERWTGSEGTAALQVQLAPGAHRVEIRSAGRHTFTSEVTIRAGQTTPLNVSLVQTEAPEPAAAPAPPRTTSQPARPSESGIDIKTAEDGFMIAPDYRVTEINHSTAHLIGAYGGYVFGGQMLIGGVDIGRRTTPTARTSRMRDPSSNGAYFPIRPSDSICTDSLAVAGSTPTIRSSRPSTVPESIIMMRGPLTASEFRIIFMTTRFSWRNPRRRSSCVWRRGSDYRAAPDIARPRLTA